MRPDVDFLSALRSAYELEEITSLTPLVSWGRTLRAFLEVGSDTYFLKQKVFYLTATEFKQSLLFQEYLYTLGGPVVKPTVTKHGELTWHYEDKIFSLQSHVFGNPLSLMGTPGDLFELGKVVGRLTLLSAFFPGKKDLSVPIARNRWFPDTAVSITAYMDFLSPPDVTEYVDYDVIAEIKQIFMHALADVPWENLPKSWIHGDMAFDNTICGDKLYLIDWDEARYSHRLWDICKIMALAGSFTELSEKRISVAPRWQTFRMRRLWEGFAEEVVLHQVEREALSKLILTHAVLNFISEFDLDDPAEPTKQKETLSACYQKLLLLLKTPPNLSEILSSKLSYNP